MWATIGTVGGILNSCACASPPRPFRPSVRASAWRRTRVHWTSCRPFRGQHGLLVAESLQDAALLRRGRLAAVLQLVEVRLAVLLVVVVLLEAREEMLELHLARSTRLGTASGRLSVLLLLWGLLLLAAAAAAAEHGVGDPVANHAAHHGTCRLANERQASWKRCNRE